jgi:hypothetical protein
MKDVENEPHGLARLKAEETEANGGHCASLVAPPGKSPCIGLFSAPECGLPHTLT